MLECLSNSYDYLVDEGAELSSTTELLLDRTNEQAIVDIMIPSLVLLINLFHILRETKEQYRNKRLLRSLPQLHREVSPRLAACAEDLSFMFPTFAIGFGVVCHLITSALACWPLYNWAPGLFHYLLENVEATNASVPLGPKAAFSLLCLLGDLFPDEGVWLWKVELPSLSAIRSLSTSTVLGPQVEKVVNWYMHPDHVAILLVRLMPQLDRLARIIENFATSALMVIQDMLRIFIVRVASEKIECAVVLLRPIFIWLEDKVDEVSLSEREIFKVHQLLQFIVKLSEHPNGKALLWKMGVARILRKLLQNCSSASFSDDTTFGRASSTNDLMFKWRIPLFKALAYIFSIDPQNEKAAAEEPLSDKSVHECSSIMHHLLMFCQVLPVGREMLACSLAFKELAASYTCRSAVTLIFSQIHTSNQDVLEKDEGDANHNSSTVDHWGCFSSLFKCWKKLAKFIGSNQPTDYLVETVYSFTLGAIALSQCGENLEGLLILRYLFGLPSDPSGSLESSSDSLSEIALLMKTFEEKICQGFGDSKTSVGKSLLRQVLDSITLLCSILESSGLSADSIQMVLEEGTDSPSKVARSIVMTSHLMPSLVDVPVNDESPFLFSNAWKVIVDSEQPIDCQEGEFAKKLVWELPDSSLDRQLMHGQSARRKLALGENASRRIRDNQVPEPTGQFSRGLNTTNASSGHTRRDTFRQRKPNTSRPPSMHVDDYVARERNIDGASSASNIVNSTPRGTLSGRPPSIHVDEFMARQRERQNPLPAPTGDAPQVKSQTSLDDNLRAKPENVRQPKADLDDDQEIEIVFDEESGSDDKLPFPQPDDSLQSPPVVIGENSPGPIVEETENQENGRIPFSQRATSLQKDDESPDVHISSQAAMLTEANDPLERKYSVPSPERNSFRDHVSPVSGRSSAQGGHQQSSRSRYEKRSPHKFSETSLSSGSRGHEHRHSNSHPPLPPMPPPISSMPAQNPDSANRQSSSYSSRDRPMHNASGYPTQSFDASMPNAFTGLQGQTQYMLTGTSGSSSNDLPNAEAKLLWNTFSVNTFSSGLSARPMPPPPPYSAVATQHATMGSSSPSTLYNQGNVVQPSPTAAFSDSNLGMNSASGSMLPSNLLPSFAPQFLMGRPPTSFFGTPLPQVQLSSALPQNISNSQPSVSVQPRPPPPPPPPQQPHPSQTLQQLGAIQLPQQDQPLSYPQSTILPQVPLQFPNQLPIPQLQLYQQSQQESVQALRQLGEQSQLQNQGVQADSFSQQQQDSGINLNQLFSSPEAIQSLLSDREKLCQLLEQNPKLMQMLQDRIGL